MLASASKDKTAIIWQVQRQEQRLVKKLTLTGHTESIAYLAWSPDDTMLATCGNDNSLRVWSSSSGECLKDMTHHSKEVSSVAWLPDSEAHKVHYLHLHRPVICHAAGRRLAGTAGYAYQARNKLLRTLLQKGRHATHCAA